LFWLPPSRRATRAGSAKEQVKTALWVLARYKVEALYQQQQTAQLPADAEGTKMRKLRAEVHRRMLGNGYCARPVEFDCHFESICESCTFFVLTVEFRPTLQAQRDGAEHKGQLARKKIFDGLIERLDATGT
jgi:hypothetical protein